MYAHVNHSNCKELEQVNKLSDEMHCEIATIQHNQIRLMSIYRTPMGNFEVFLEKLTLALEVFCKAEGTKFVAGDFNVRFHNVFD